MLTQSDNALNGTVANRALPFLYGGSLEITLTVPLNTDACYAFDMCPIILFFVYY